jgi:O-acetyl-ADP-ribose deacetylase (regulator of RNase III)
MEARMSFSYAANEDITHSSDPILGNTVNCEGPMGKGVALAIKNRFPAIEAPFRAACKGGRFGPGLIHVFKASENQTVVSLATKDTWRGKSRYEWVGSSLVYLSLWLQHHKPESIALPAPGCENGGLSWDVVHDMARTYLQPAVDAGVQIRFLKDAPDMRPAPFIFAGIGSRDTPDPILDLMKDAGALLAHDGWTLRSGGAVGADTAFETGVKSCPDHPKPEIYYANERSLQKAGNSYGLLDTRQVHNRMVGVFHPKPSALSPSGFELMARNGCQVFGPDFTQPSSCVVCFTEGGKGKGGTGQAIRMSNATGIPVIDLGKPELQGITAAEILTMARSLRAERIALREPETAAMTM